MMANGIIIPACAPATMNVELSYLSELLQLAAPVKGVKLAVDHVAEALPVLRLLGLVAKSKRRDRRPTDSSCRDCVTTLPKRLSYHRSRWWTSLTSPSCPLSKKAKLHDYSGPTSTPARKLPCCVTQSTPTRRLAIISAFRSWVTPGPLSIDNRGR